MSADCQTPVNVVLTAAVDHVRTQHARATACALTILVKHVSRIVLMQTVEVMGVVEAAERASLFFQSANKTEPVHALLSALPRQEANNAAALMDVEAPAVRARTLTKSANPASVYAKAIVPAKPVETMVVVTAVDHVPLLLDLCNFATQQHQTASALQEQGNAERMAVVDP